VQLVGDSHPILCLDCYHFRHRATILGNVSHDLRVVEEHVASKDHKSQVQKRAQQILIFHTKLDDLSRQVPGTRFTTRPICEHSAYLSLRNPTSQRSCRVFLLPAPLHQSLPTCRTPENSDPIFDFRHFGRRFIVDVQAPRSLDRKTEVVETALLWGEYTLGVRVPYWRKFWIAVINEEYHRVCEKSFFNQLPLGGVLRAHCRLSW
jgi:hypothetical protein